MPSAKILAQKEEALQKLTESMKAAKSGVLVDYKGITVADDTELRAMFRKEGVSYHVYKNTLTSRACDNVGLTEMKASLEGMTALALGQDEVSAAKIAKKYADKIETFEIKCGFVDGVYFDKEAILSLAEIPSKEGLIAKMLGSLQSPLFGLACVLKAIADKKEAGAEAPAAE